MSDFLTAALDYQLRGWSVIPLRSDGDEKARKRPSVEWARYQTTAATEEELRAWAASNPHSNLGVVTGSVSGLCVIDLDGPNAVALLKDRGIVLPPTAAVQTGKGFHVYYAYGGKDIHNMAAVLSDGRGSAVDVRGEGGYVVAPPSVHGSGRVYAWTVPPDELRQLPVELEELLLSRQLDTSATTVAPEDDANWYARIAQGVPEGQRNDAAARLAGYWLRVTGNNREAALRACEAWNARNDPPMPQHELAQTVASIAKAQKRSELAEESKKLPRIEVLSGEEWAAEMEVASPRHGVAVETPGISMVDGLVEGDLLVMAGRPGMGKSTWATQLCVEACIDKSVPTYVISSEMTRNQWGRWMAAVIGKCRCGDLSYRLPSAILDAFRRAPIAISDAGTITIDEIRSLAEGRMGLKLLIVDHLGRISAGKRKESRTLEVGEVVRGLKGLAKDLKCTVVALSQLNREIEARDGKRPKLGDLRESGEVEQEADGVFFLSVREPFPHGALVRKLNLTLSKFRFGPTTEVPIEFYVSHRRMEVGT